MGLEWGGFILMISHYKRVAIPGYIEMYYYYYPVVSQTNKQNKTNSERNEERKKQEQTGTGWVGSVIFKGMAL